MRPDTEVLLVEDDAGDRELVERALSRVARPGRWAIVGSVAEAKDYLNRAGVFTGAAEPHLIVLDLKLPGGDGREVLDYIKRDEALHHIPAVIFSGNLSPETVIDCYSKHANCCVSKPFDGKEYEDVLVAELKFWSNTIFLPSRDVSTERRKLVF